MVFSSFPFKSLKIGLKKRKLSKSLKIGLKREKTIKNQQSKKDAGQGMTILHEYIRSQASFGLNIC